MDLTERALTNLLSSGHLSIKQRQTDRLQCLSQKGKGAYSNHSTIVFTMTSTSLPIAVNVKDGNFNAVGRDQITQVHNTHYHIHSQPGE
jgi:hypothetical protein